MIEFLKRHALSLVVLAGLAVLAFAVVDRVLETSEPQAARRPGGGSTPVVVAEVIRAPFVDSLQAVGSAAANESVQISANASDRVVEVPFSEGALVKAGTVLVRLDTVEEEAELAEALANLADAERQRDRLEALLATNSAARSQFDEARARVEASQARVRVVRARIRDREIRAPFDGVLGLREVSPGALVAPGTAITTLDDIEPIKLDFRIPENFLATLRTGATIRARTVAYPDRVFPGVVAHLSPRVDPVTRSVAVRAELPNRERLLRPGMLLTVDLLKDRREALMVPEGALIPQGERQYLFRVVDGSVERVEVGIGARRPGIVEITRGLEIGDTVVVEGGIRLRQGAPVTVQREIDSVALIPREDLEGAAIAPAGATAGSAAIAAPIGPEFGG